MSDTDYGLTTIDSPSSVHQQPPDPEKSQSSDNNDENGQEKPTRALENQDIERGEQIHGWLNLVCDYPHVS